MLRKLQSFVILLATLLAVSCKDAPHTPAEARDAEATQVADANAKSPYAGHWVNVTGLRVLTIVQEGDAFIVQDESKKRFVARLEKGVLRVGTPAGGSIDILHVRASDRLVGGGEEYRRASEAEAVRLAQRLDTATARRDSMQRMRAIATAWEARATDINSYTVLNLANGAVPPDVLAGALMPTYIRDMPRTDAWSRPLLFEVSGNGMAYTIRSGGDNGQIDLQTPPGATSTPGADIVFSNGNFISYPAGIE